MNLLILGSNMDRRGNPAYRGTDRSWPSHIDGLPDDHPANRAFFWFCREGGETGVVHDLHKSLQLVSLYREAHPQEPLELIEVGSGRAASQSGGTHLGFDLSCGFCGSLLSGGLAISSNALPETLLYLNPLFRLIETNFRPQLNSNGLFSDYSTAKFCLECMLVLQKVHPDLWESQEAAEFEVVSIYSVSARVDR